MTYDMKCAELAKAFLSDYRAKIEGDKLSGGKGDWDFLVDDLAKRIQSTIEDFLEEKMLS